MKKEFGSEFELQLNSSLSENELLKKLEVGFKFRSGRDVLRALAEKYKNKKKRVLIPALSCESMIIPFIDNSFEVIFYKLNPDYSIDEIDMFSKLTNDSILLYMDYFGNKSLSEDMLKRIKVNYQGIITIEDITHNILDFYKKNIKPDYSICSIRKWIAIPDGGLLFANKNMQFNFGIDSFFSNVRFEAMCRKRAYLEDQVKNEKKEYREEFKKANTYLDKIKTISMMTKKSEEILNLVNLKDIYIKRKNNSKTLENLLSKELGIFGIHNHDTAPLYYPILTKNRGTVQKKLADEKIYCPVIWPISLEQKEICKIAKMIDENVLAIPCDQRYSMEDMKHIGSIIVRIMREL